MNSLERNQITVDGVTFDVDGISYEYAQLDGENAGRSDNGKMTRDVIGLTNKVYCSFNDKSKWYGQNLSNLLQLIKKKQCSLNYFDSKEYKRLTKTMYLVMDKVETTLIDGETYLKNDVEVRFIQMDVDNI